MKKKLLLAVLIFAVIIAALALVPVIFRDALLEKTKTTISKNLKANIGFEDFRLSLIRHFPKAGLSLKNVVITGKDEFAGDTLLHIGSLSTRFGLFDLLSPDNLTLNELILDQATLKLLVNSNEKANWDIFPSEDEGIREDAKEEESFGMELSRIVVNHARLQYLDFSLPLTIGAEDINLILKGNMYGSDTKLRIEGDAAEFNLSYDSVSYISHIRLQLQSLLDINFDSYDFRFGEGELLVNALPLALDGNFSLPGDSMLFDLRFNSKISEVSQFLNLIPPSYAHYIKDLQAKGDASFHGSFKGIYFEEDYPALNILFKISNGNIKYAGLPEEIKNITGNIAVEKPQGVLNLTSVRIADAHAEIRNNPVNGSLTLGNLMDDLHFNGSLTGKVNFDHLKDAIPMDSVQISGIMDVDLGVAGRMSNIENKTYEMLKTEGLVALNNFSFESNQLTMPVKVSSGKLDFAPEKVNLQQLDLKIGQSDVALTGNVTDYYPYIFTGGSLSGSFILASDFLNLNELMSLQKPEFADPGKTGQGKSGEQASDTLKSAPATFEVPERLKLAFQTDIKKALYDKLNIRDISGRVAVNDGRLDLNGVTMNVLDGELKLAGSYENSPQKTPMIDMNVEMISFDIPSAFQSMDLVRKYLPIAAQSKGKFSTSLKLNGRLNETMDLMMGSLNGTGLINSQNLQVINSPVFNKVKSVLKDERLRDLKIDDFVASFTIENGNLLLKPFKTRISGQEATFSGKLNADNLIDMQIGFIVQRDALSQNIENTLGVLPGQKNIQLIPVDVYIKGPVNNPEVKVDLSEAKKMIRKEVGNATRDEIKESINKIGDGLKKLFK